MCVGPRQHALLTKAVEVMNQDRTAFILDVACREAENVLLDQRLFQLDDDRFAAFEAALDAPVPDNAKLHHVHEGIAAITGLLRFCIVSSRLGDDKTLIRHRQNLVYILTR